MYFYIFKKYRIIKIQDNKLKIKNFLNNFLNRKGVLGLCRVVGFRLGVQRVMPLAYTKLSRATIVLLESTYQIQPPSMVEKPVLPL
jgi:hypothetical protein